MDYQESVTEHYARFDAERHLLQMIQSAGKDPEHFLPADLQGADQLHLGGAAATTRVALRAGIASGSRVLDIGSGMGGVARQLAHDCGAVVHGVDLTPAFVATARSLTQRTGLTGSVTIGQGSALALPFDDDAFDVAVMVHVGMNIAEKDTAFAEAARVLRPGGVIAVYDVMLTNGGAAEFPLPWSATPDASFVCSPLEYSELLDGAGFEVDVESKTVAEALEFLDRALDPDGPGGPMGVATPALEHLRTAIRAGYLAPVEIYAHLPA